MTSLFNVSEDTNSTEPLLIHMPPLPFQEGIEPVLPTFFDDRPVASINYRWERIVMSADPTDEEGPKPWPTPVHDTAFAYKWLLDNLAPAKNGRRDIYVYGSHFGAGLAVSLALTECHAHAPFGVRGLIAYNGVYNWSMFLPEHRVHRASKKTRAEILPELAVGPHMDWMRQCLPVFFDETPNMFDAFASPSLFFHTAGVAVPKNFPSRTKMPPVSKRIDAMLGKEAKREEKPPRKAHLTFPPRKSTLKIPDTLLLFTAPPASSAKAFTKVNVATQKARIKRTGNSFETQAGELAELMRRSIDTHELKERKKWDHDVDEDGTESTRRVQMVDLGPETQSSDLTDAGENLTREWLRQRVTRSLGNSQEG